MPAYRCRHYSYMVGPLTTLDGSLTLECSRYGETYRSRRGALTEARHVFLDASGVAGLLPTRKHAKVLELGFGTGLTFLVTAEAAARSGARLEYVAFERDPLGADVLADLRYAELLAPFDGPDELVEWWTSLGTPVPEGAHEWRHGQTTLTLMVGEAARLIGGIPGGTFDAVYLDPFSPRANPDAWAEALLGGMAAALAPGGRLVTYSVSGEVRRRLQRAGLAVKKVPGPEGGKRESLVAQAGAA